MELKWHPSIKPDQQERILAMSDVELTVEIERAPYSSNPATIPFMKAILAARHEERERTYNEVMLAEAKRSNAVSLRANRLSILAIAISLVALAVSVFRSA